MHQARRNLTDFVKLELAEIKRARLRHKNLDRKKEIGALYGRGNTKEKVLSIVDKTFIDDTPHDTQKEIAADLGWMYNRMKKAQGGTGANQYKEQRGHFVPSAKTAELIAQQTRDNM